MTLRELFWMAAGAWDHTAAVTAVLINVNRGKGDKAVSPAKLNPYRQALKKKPKPMITERNFDVLKTVFIDRKGI